MDVLIIGKKFVVIKNSLFLHNESSFCPNLSNPRTNEYCGNFYGTMKDRLKELLKKHEVVLLEIDVNGAEKVYEKMKCVRVFVLPPSFCELKKRLLKRGSETEEVLKKRLNQAFFEIEKSGRYDYLIVNESVEQTARYLKEIITAEKLKTFRSIKKIEQLLKERF